LEYSSGLVPEFIVLWRLSFTVVWVKAVFLFCPLSCFYCFAFIFKAPKMMKLSIHTDASIPKRKATIEKDTSTPVLVFSMSR